MAKVLRFKEGDIVKIKTQAGHYLKLGTYAKVKAVLIEDLRHDYIVYGYRLDYVMDDGTMGMDEQYVWENNVSGLNE